MNILSVRGVERRFDTTLALQATDFDVAENDFVTILGPSGCGKSTLLRIVAGLDVPTAGNVLLDGRRITSPGADRGMVFQSYTLFPWLSVLDNVCFGLRERGMPRPQQLDIAHGFLQKVGLQGFANHYPKQLSGGMQQRTALARALANNPRMLLMDEPFGAVDPITRERLQEEFLRIQREIQKTILFVTHDIDEAVKLADRICLMRDGKVEQYATPENLLAYPSSDFVRDFVGADRELKRLGRVSVASLMRPLDGAEGGSWKTESKNSVPGTLSARDALSRLLEAGGELPVLDAQGSIIGTISLNDLTVANMDQHQRKA